MSNKKRDREFVACVYEDDYRQIQELVQQYPNIETGGDLFGLWKDESTVVIQLFIGPGKNCKRTTSSFHQDIEYLHRVGSLVTTEEGLCNVGEWHSHHQIGMPEPSAADRRTVFNNMPQLGLERFVLFIATIETGYRPQGKTKKRPHDVRPEQVTLRSFLFLGPTQNVLRGKIEIIPGKNPHQIRNRAIKEIKDGAEKPAAQDEPSGPKTTKEQAKGPKDVEENAADKPKREKHSCKESGTVPLAQKHGDNQSPPTGRKHEGDQHYRRGVEYQSTSKSRDKRNPNQPQATSGFSDQNVSPNLGLGQPTNRGTQSNVPTSSLSGNQNFHFSNPPPQTYTTQGRGRGPSTSTDPPVSSLHYYSAATQHSGQRETRSGTQRENQVMAPSTTRDSFQSKGFPNDPPLTGRTAARGHDARGNMHSTTSYFQEKLMPRSSNAGQEKVGGGTEPVNLRKMNGKGFF